jgi:hypothetical protein
MKLKRANGKHGGEGGSKVRTLKRKQYKNSQQIKGEETENFSEDFKFDDFSY